MKARQTAAGQEEPLRTGWLERLGRQPVFLSVQRGLVLALPLIMVGALALLLRDFPLPAVQRLLSAVAGPTWRVVCEDVIAGSFGIASLAVLCSISSALTALHNQRHADRFASPIMAAVLALSCFFVLTAPAATGSWQSLFSLDRGLVVAVCVAMAGTGLFLRLSRVRFLQLPVRTAGADFVIRDVLGTLPAGMATILVFGLLRWLLVAGGIPDLHAALRRLPIVPCAVSGDSLGFGLVYSGLSQLLWFFGMHGPNMLYCIEENILAPAGLANAAAIASGVPPPHVLTKAFFDAFTRMGGSGCTLCLIIAILLKSRNSGSQKLCLLALLPALCNVNEPLLFGIPLVLNPIYLIPFLVAPCLQTVAAYGATLAGFVPYTAANGAWTTPALISGFTATGSMAGTAMQGVNLALGVAVYLPFVRLADRLRERQGKRVLGALVRAAGSCLTGPHGWKCLGRPAEEGCVAKALADDLTRALARGEQLFLEFQPQVDMVGARVYGMEALLRWEHPVYGLIPPPLTVALAEDLGCIDRLGLFVLREACAQRAAWKGLVPDGLTVSVNVSPRQFADALFGQKVLGVLAASGLDATTLVVEITEGSVLEPDARTVATLRWLREMGVRVAIDDFGMGHASLRYLREFPVDVVKIDRSLTLAGSDGVSEHIVRSVVGLSRSLDILTVVEGVELAEQLDRFLALGCGTFQGYLFSRPVSGRDCLTFIRQWRPTPPSKTPQSWQPATSCAGIPTTS